MNSYSQAKQDLFVLEQTQYKKNGTFLDIGCAEPTIINNTFLLEKEYNWYGIGIDIRDFNDQWKIRKSKFIKENALTINYDEILKEISVNNRMDYLSLDLEPPEITYEALKILISSKFRFSVITYEHDEYRGYSHIKENSRKLFQEMNYILIKGDVGAPEYCAEDWYIDGQIR